jgi:hypothetical protein
VDYRPLKVVNIKKKYQLHFTEDLFDHLNGAKAFSKIDDHSGYNQICVREHNIEKSVASTKYVHLKLCVLVNQGLYHVYGDNKQYPTYVR